jgi:hypothetical protein
MSALTFVVRLLFGLAFTVFGLNGVLMALDMAFMPAPEVMPAAAAAFLQALTDSGYMMPLLGGTQLVSGLLILSGACVPLGLTLLAPVVVNIVLYHHVVDPAGLGIAYVVLVLELFLAYAYGPAFRGVLAAGAKPRWTRHASGTAAVPRGGSP